MKRFILFTIYLCLVGVVGCNQYKIEELRAELLQARRTAEVAQRRATQADERVVFVEARAAEQLGQARRLRSEALKVGKIAAQRIAASESVLEKASDKREEARKVLAEVEISKRQIETDRIQLEQVMIGAHTLIDEAETAQIEAANARVIAAEVKRLVAETRENRKVAEQAYDAAERVRKVAIAEKETARAEQRAATLAIEAAETEKQAARDAIAAAQVAKCQIDEERLVLDLELADMVLAKREATRERLAAERATSLAASAEIRAKQARIESVRQRLLIAERLSVLDAAKEAAEVGERMAHVARATAAAERSAAKNARIAAEQAQREATTEQAFVRDIIDQLRVERFGSGYRSGTSKETAAANKGRTR